MYKLPSKGPSSQPQGNMGTKLREGIYLGHEISSNVHVCSCAHDGSIVKGRSVYRRPESERWSAEAMASVKATPWSTRDRVTVSVELGETIQEEGGSTF